MTSAFFKDVSFQKLKLRFIGKSLIKSGLFMQVSVPDLVGHVGVLFILISYFMLQAEKVRYDDFSYLFMNIFGSVFLVISLIYSYNQSAFLIEAFWIGISVYGLVKKIMKRREDNRRVNKKLKGSFQGTPEYTYG